jgi:alpha-beta hydrolase superfamily lysophospholipase
MNSTLDGDLTAFNKPFEPARTPFDWLSRDTAVVDAYVADPLCGFQLKPASMMSLGMSALRLADAKELARIRKDLPIYLFAGDADPLNTNLNGSCRSPRAIAPPQSRTCPSATIQTHGTRE